jgi:hypothetical protein
VLACAGIVAASAYLAAPAPALWSDLHDFELVGPVPTEVRTLASGLTVYFAPQGGCSTAPLPCTPNFNPRLALRTPGDLGSGFYSIAAP